MRLLLILLLLVVVVTTKSSSRGSSNSRASISTTHSTHTTSLSPTSKSKTRSSSHRSSTTRKPPSMNGSGSLHDTRKDVNQPNPTRSRPESKSRSIQGNLGGSGWATSRPIGNARSRSGSAARAAQLAQTGRTSDNNVPTTKKPGRLQQIKDKLPAIIEKLKEKLKPKLPAITAAAKKYGPKVGKMLWKKFREKTTTPRPLTVATGSIPMSQSTGSVPTTVLTRTIYSAKSASVVTPIPTVVSTTATSAGDEIFIEYNDDFRSECPEKVDAFIQLGNISFIFESHHLFLFEDGSLKQTTAISNLFPEVHRVDASVFDTKQELILLIKERTVFGFHWNEDNGNFTLAENFPKYLPESIKLTPYGAFTWHDGYPVLISADGEFVVYDSYWNRQIDIGSAGESYLENLPLTTHGLSDWEDKKTIVFTTDKIYEYDSETKNIIGEETSLRDFFGCYFVDIPSGNSTGI